MLPNYNNIDIISNKKNYFVIINDSQDACNAIPDQHTVFIPITI